MGARLAFARLGAGDVALDVEAVTVAGWAGRDEAALRHHIEELAAIGVPRPSSTPVFYRVGASLPTQDERVEVLGPDTSGEAEPVLVSLPDGLWLTVGSDHTDRVAEAAGIALSKQLCAKPVGRELWRLADVEARWDALTLRAWATIDGERTLYQDGALAALRPPADLLARLGREARLPGGALPPGALLFGGTLGALGGIRPATRFEAELGDPETGRTIRCAYDVAALPVVS